MYKRFTNTFRRDEYPLGDYSAIVYKEGDSVVAEDYKGTLIAEGISGVDDASVIQSALDVGGKFFIARGEYIADNLSIDKPVIVEGEGLDTKIYGTSIDNYIFVIGKGGSYSADGPLGKVVIKDMEIGGRITQYVKGAIDADYTDHLIIENLRVPYCAGDCIRIGSGTDSFNEFTQIRNVRTFGAGSSYVGLSIAYSMLPRVENFQAEASKGNGIGIFLWNVIEPKMIQIGLAHLDMCVKFQSTYINIEDIWIEDATYGFYNEFGYGGTVRGLHNAGGIDTLEYYGEGSDNYRINYGTTTISESRNYGTTTITCDGSTTTFNIPHGLVSTPSFVTVEPKAGAPVPDSKDADDTNIILTFDVAPASGTYYYWWKAEV